MGFCPSARASVFRSSLKPQKSISQLVMGLSDGQYSCAHHATACPPTRGHSVRNFLHDFPEIRRDKNALLGADWAAFSQLSGLISCSNTSTPLTSSGWRFILLTLANVKFPVRTLPAACSLAGSFRFNALNLCACLAVFITT